MKLTNRFSLLLTFFAVAAIAFATGQIKIADVLTGAAKYDGKVITVQGTVAKFKQKTSKAGHPYFVFDVLEGTKKLEVYGQGELKPAPKNGQKVEVTGSFVKEKTIGSFTVKNEIDVTKKPDVKASAKNGVKILDK